MKLDSKTFTFVKAVERYMGSLHKDAAGKKILIAVSGGVDSCVLLDVLWQLRESVKFHLAVCHVNHGLRGNESNEDEKFVIQRTRDYDLPLTVRRLDEQDKERILAGNMEEQARELRYQLLAHTAEELNYDFIATGHTKSDQAETVLHHLIRSSGLSGLSGILPVAAFHEHTVIRPLLCRTRENILEYARQRNLPFRHDSMNDDPRFTRVSIRTSLLPLLKNEYNPNLEESLSRLASLCRDEELFWQKHIHTIHKNTGEAKAESPADRNTFLQYTPAEQKRLLRYWFQQNGIDPSYIQIEESLSLVTNPKPQAEIQLQGDKKFIRRYDRFYIGESVSIDQIPICVPLAIPGKTTVPELQIEITADWIPKNVIKMEKHSKWQTGIDYHLVKHGLWIRARKDGDTIQPLGMKGNKKLKKLMQEYEIPIEKRHTLPVICDQENIVWIPGCCESGLYKVTPQTQEMLYLSVKNI